MKQHFDKGIGAALALALLLALSFAAALAAFGEADELRQSRQGASQSFEVQSTLQQVASAAQDAESGARGYLLTRDIRHLESYESAHALGDRLLRHLGDATDNPAQRAELAELRRLFRKHLAELAYMLGYRSRLGVESVREEALTDRERSAMEALRRQVDRMEGIEARTLDSHKWASSRSLELVRGALLFCAIVALMALGLLGVQVRRNFVEHDAALAVLGEQKDLFRTTLSTLGEAVVTCNAAGRVTYLNAAAETLTGWHADKALGLPIDDVVRVVDSASHEPLESCAQRALATGAAVPSAHRGKLLSRGAGERPIEDSAFPFRDAEGRINGAVLVFRDITERKRSEDALIEADRRKDEFLAVLAHELRNPLAPLRNALQILGMSPGDRAAVEQVRAMMERQVRQMVRLIDDLLDVSRISTNKIDLRRERLDVKEVVDAALEMSAPTVNRYRHRVEFTLAPRCPSVDCDRARLVQVLDNLVTNAAKYSEPGGRISIFAEPSGDKLCIRVKDTGIGIPRHMLERVFEMFTQVDRSLERSRNGLGIGLTLVRRIVELHGGTVTAKSEGPGRGSEFVILLPAAGARARPGPECRAPALETAPPRRVLVTDDNEDSAESMARTLRIGGHDVRTAFDGEQCVKVCRDFNPEVVLLDIGMPRMNGYDAARRIREQPWGRAIMLVAMTGWGQDEDRRRARDAGFDHHLVKPVDFSLLMQLLRNAKPNAMPMDERSPAHADR